MNPELKHNLVTATLIGTLAITSILPAQAQTAHFDELANLPFAEGPTHEGSPRAS